MAIAKKPKRGQTDIAKPDPMTFIQGANLPAEETPAPEPGSAPAPRKRKEPVIIRFDDETLSKVDRAATKRKALSFKERVLKLTIKSAMLNSSLSEAQRKEVSDLVQDAILETNANWTAYLEPLVGKKELQQVLEPLNKVDRDSPAPS